MRPLMPLRWRKWPNSWARDAGETRGTGNDGRASGRPMRRIKVAAKEGRRGRSGCARWRWDRNRLRSRRGAREPVASAEFLDEGEQEGPRRRGVRGDDLLRHPPRAVEEDGF